MFRLFLILLVAFLVAWFLYRMLLVLIGPRRDQHAEPPSHAQKPPRIPQPYSDVRDAKFHDIQDKSE